jgi:sugar (pentulose or hexulose) kinase
VYTAGGASNSDSWLTIRSNVMNKPLYKMKYVSGAVGAAVLAASKTYFSSVIDAVKQLVVIDKEVHPERLLVEKYEANYQKFIQTMIDKGYMKGGFDA